MKEVRVHERKRATGENIGAAGICGRSDQRVQAGGGFFGEPADHCRGCGALRAAGHEILATPHGYICERARSGVVCQVACRHDAAQMQEELNAIVDQGCTVLDVIVSHPIYGQLTGQLNLSSRYEVAAFIEKATSASAQPISVLTDGIHLHTLQCPDEAAAERVRRALAALGILME